VIRVGAKVPRASTSIFGSPVIGFGLAPRVDDRAMTCAAILISGKNRSAVGLPADKRMIGHYWPTLSLRAEPRLKRTTPPATSESPDPSEEPSPRRAMPPLTSESLWM